MAGKSLNLLGAARDADGRLLVDASRSMVDLLPPAVDVAPAVTPAVTPSRRVQVAVAVAAVLVLAAAWALLPRTGAVPAATSPTLAPTVVAAAATLPSAAPTAAALACVVTRAAATFYAPAGDPTGDALDPGTACVLIGWHSGFADWRQITAGGTPVWVRASVLSTADAAGLPDLAPPPTPTPAPATARPIVIIEQAPPAPTQCATVRGGGAAVQRCGSAPLEQLQADAEAAWRAQMQPTAKGGE